MSVAKGKRGSSHLDAQTKTDEMVAHTIKILSNPNVFGPSQHALIDKVMECAIGIGECVNDANSVRVDGDLRKWATRRDLQDRALLGFGRMLYLVRLCKPVFGLRKGKVYYWTKLVSEAQALVRAWRESDAQRYGRPESGT